MRIYVRGYCICAENVVPLHRKKGQRVERDARRYGGCSKKLYKFFCQETRERRQMVRRESLKCVDILGGEVNWNKRDCQIHKSNSMKKQFVLPVMSVIAMESNLIATSGDAPVTTIYGNTNLKFGGVYDGYGRAPERGGYDWDAGY